jgi:hypothetical protein
MLRVRMPPPERRADEAHPAGAPVLDNDRIACASSARRGFAASSATSRPARSSRPRVPINQETPVNLRVLCGTAAAVLAFAASPAALAAPDTYTATLVDHPAASLDDFRGIAIADNGAVLAASTDTVSRFWYTDANGVGVHERPAALDGLDLRGMVDVNSSGQVLGTYVPVRGQGVHGFLTGPDGIGLTDLGAVSPSALDDRGRATGTIDTKKGFRSDPKGGVHTLATLGPGFVSPVALRNGMVVGFQQITGAVPATHAFHTGPDGHSLVDMGTLVPGGDSWAWAVNADGRIVGYASNAFGGPTAVIAGADGSGFTTLDPNGRYTNSYATGIDRGAHVVGHGYRAGDSVPSPFITGAGGVGLFDLNKYVQLPNGSRLGEVVGMNERGQILAMDVLTDAGPWVLTPTRASWESEIGEQ